LNKKKPQEKGVKLAAFNKAAVAAFNHGATTHRLVRKVEREPGGTLLLLRRGVPFG